MDDAAYVFNRAYSQLRNQLEEREKLEYYGCRLL